MIDKKMLPKETKSICPKCKKILLATIYEKDGKVMIHKTCDEHGDFDSVYWSDINMYYKAKNWAVDGDGVSNPKKRSTGNCPNECGLCNRHLSHTVLGLIDLTDFCNTQCPGCFAGVEKLKEKESFYLPTFEQVVEMMEMLKDEKKVRCSTIQFSGGEPTLHPDLPKIIKKANDLEFSHIQIATNGLKMADFNYCKELYDAGLHTVYLQFDGFNQKTYDELREKDKWEFLLQQKKKTIENCERVNKDSMKDRPLAVVLVPTLKKTINDDEIGEIVKFGLAHSEVIRGINFQPYSFGEKEEEMEIITKRYTIPDLIHDLEQQTDFLRKEDFYPVPSVVPISKFISSLIGKPIMTFSAHPHCGMATIILFLKDKQTGLQTKVQIPRILDVDGVLHKISKLTKISKMLKIIIRLMQILQQIKRKFGNKIKIPNNIQKFFKKIDLFKFFFADYIKETPETEAALEMIRKFMRKLVTMKGKEPFKDIFWEGFYIGGMHFQDNWNYDLERLRRCCIHYATPDGRIIPFCSYNSGPYYRKEIQEHFSIPLEEWRRRISKQ